MIFLDTPRNTPNRVCKRKQEDSFYLPVGITLMALFTVFGGYKKGSETVLGVDPVIKKELTLV